MTGLPPVPIQEIVSIAKAGWNQIIILNFYVLHQGKAVFNNDHTSNNIRQFDLKLDTVI